MSAYPPEVVEAVQAAIAEAFAWDWPATPEEHIPSAVDCCDDAALAALDAVTAATPTLRHHDDGRLILEWADEPAVGALVVVKADVLRRLVDKANERASVAPSGASEGGAGVPGPPETDASVNTASGITIEEVSDQYGPYKVIWACEPPPTGSRVRITDAHWSADFERRTIFAWEMAE